MIDPFMMQADDPQTLDFPGLDQRVVFTRGNGDMWIASKYLGAELFRVATIRYVANQDQPWGWEPASALYDDDRWDTFPELMHAVARMHVERP